MPTYAYACTACDHSFEVQQSFSDASLTECPECAGRLRKLFNAVGIVFKGSGFYRTDSRSSGKSTGKSASLPASSSSSSSSSLSSSASGTSSSGASGSSTAAKSPAPASSGSTGSAA